MLATFAMAYVHPTIVATLIVPFILGTWCAIEDDILHHQRRDNDGT